MEILLAMLGSAVIGATLTAIVNGVINRSKVRADADLTGVQAANLTLDMGFSLLKEEKDAFKEKQAFYKEQVDFFKMRTSLLEDEIRNDKILP